MSTYIGGLSVPKKFRHIRMYIYIYIHTYVWKDITVDITNVQEYVYISHSYNATPSFQRRFHRGHQSFLFPHGDSTSQSLSRMQDEGEDRNRMRVTDATPANATMQGLAKSSLLACVTATHKNRPISHSDRPCERGQERHTPHCISISDAPQVTIPVPWRYLQLG